MNYLAHIYFSGSNPEYQIGGFIGDFVKGNYHEKFTTDIEFGIKLHREIDRISDFLPAFIQSRSRIDSKYRRFSGIFIDIYYDHFLAKHWQKYSNHNLIDFSKQFMNYLNHYDQYIPESARPFINYMQIHQLFDYYIDLDHIDNVFYGMSKRFLRTNPLDKGGKELRLHYDEFETDFHQFMNEMNTHLTAYQISF